MLSAALGFPGDRVIAPFWHWRSQDFSKGYYHSDLKAFCEIGYNGVLLNIIENKDDLYIIEVYYLPILWKGLEERESKIKKRKSSLN